VAIRVGLWNGGSQTGVSADISFAHHGVLLLGELTRREARRSQSSVSDQQIDH
jgi:predicted ATPase with chaperone activity